MAQAPPQDDVVGLGPFTKGMNNVDRAHTLAGDELLLAVNLDIDRNGRLSRRTGAVKVISDPNPHSLWARDDDTAFYVGGTDLKRIDRADNDVLSVTTLRAGAFQLLRDTAFLDVNGDTYYSNGIITGRVLADGSVIGWGVPRPVSNPVLGYSGGTLPAGTYQVGVVFLNRLGEEGGMRPAVSITVPDNSRITVTGLPPAPSAEIVTTRLYVSATNGDILRAYVDLPAGTTTAVIAAAAVDGAQSDTLGMDIMPPGDTLELYRGRVYSISGRVATFSEPLRFGLTLAPRNFILVDRDITMWKAVEDGIYVGTDTRVYFYAGEGPGKFQPRIVDMSGAIPGTALTLPGKPLTIGWFSERGFRRGTAGGTVEAGDKDRIILDMFSVGAALFREQDGTRQVVATMRNRTRQGLFASDYAEAEVRRAGTSF